MERNVCSRNRSSFGYLNYVCVCFWAPCAVSNWHLNSADEPRSAVCPPRGTFWLTWFAGICVTHVRVWVPFLRMIAQAYEKKKTYFTWQIPWHLNCCKPWVCACVTEERWSYSKVHFQRKWWFPTWKPLIFYSLPLCIFNVAEEREEKMEKRFSC